MTIYDLTPGTAPIIISVPHAGTKIPSKIYDRMSDVGRSNVDLDWYVDRLYSFAHGSSASLLKAKYSRYVVDLNRPPEGGPLYDGQLDTGLCPTQSFAGEPLYQPGQEPSTEEIVERKATYWKPYHDALAGEINRLLQDHDAVVLFDAHSIRSQVPRLFDGHLPQFCFGTNDGRSASAELTAAIMDFVREKSDYRAVLNDRFKGGYITRYYGNPTKGVHAVQLELSQKTYLDEDTLDADGIPIFNTSKAVKLEPLLHQIIDFLSHTEIHRS